MPSVGRTIEPGSRPLGVAACDEAAVSDVLDGVGKTIGSDRPPADEAGGLLLVCALDDSEDCATITELVDNCEEDVGSTKIDVEVLLELELVGRMIMVGSKFDDTAELLLAMLLVEVIVELVGKTMIGGCVLDAAEVLLTALLLELTEELVGRTMTGNNALDDVELLIDVLVELDIGLVVELDGNTRTGGVVLDDEIELDVVYR